MHTLFCDAGYRFKACGLSFRSGSESTSLSLTNSMKAAIAGEIHLS